MVPSVDVAPFDAGDLGVGRAAAMGAAEEGYELGWRHVRKSFGGDVGRSDRVQGLATYRCDLDGGDAIKEFAAAAAHNLPAQGELITDVEHAPASPPGDGLGPGADLGLGK